MDVTEWLESMRKQKRRPEDVAEALRSQGYSEPDVAYYVGQYSYNVKLERSGHRLLYGSIIFVVVAFFSFYVFVHTDYGEGMLIHYTYPPSAIGSTIIAPGLSVPAISEAIKLMYNGSPEDCSRIVNDQVPWYYPHVRSYVLAQCADAFARAQLRAAWCPANVQGYSGNTACQSNIAVKLGDSKYCNGEMTCITASKEVPALSQGDVSKCVTNSCRFAIAIDTNKTALCNGNTTCLAIVTRDVAACSKSGNPPECVRLIAFLNNTVALCPKVHSAYVAVAKPKDSKYIVNLYSDSACRDGISIKNNNAATCATEHCKNLLSPQGSDADLVRLQTKILPLRSLRPDTPRQKIAALFGEY